VCTKKCQVLCSGQRQDSTLTNAQNNAIYTSLIFGNLPIQNMKILYRVILQRTGGAVTVAGTNDYRRTYF
jgi:hypothetical protein